MLEYKCHGKRKCRKGATAEVATTNTTPRQIYLKKRYLNKGAKQRSSRTGFQVQERATDNALRWEGWLE